MEEKELYKISPNYKFIYELAMPTGRKVTNIIILILVMFFIYLLISFKLTTFINPSDIEIPMDTIDSFFNIGFLLLFIFLIAKLVILLILQIMQYKNTRYTFYETYMTFEDTFLNQHRKKIVYANIREVEIRRTIWDRLNNRGVIVIYTSAENDGQNGMVMYSIKEVNDVYARVDELVHTAKEKEKKEEIKESVQEQVSNSATSSISTNTTENSNINITAKDEEKAFRDSLKN